MIPAKYAVGTVVAATFKGTPVVTTVTGHSITMKGLFYLTTDTNGVERKARAAQIEVFAGIVSERLPIEQRARPPATLPYIPPVRRKLDNQDRWPRGMSAPLAAEYIGLSESTLRVEVKAGKIKPPVVLTPGRIVYLREDLDAYLDRAAGRAAPEPAFDWNAALENMPGPGSRNRGERPLNRRSTASKLLRLALGTY